MIDAMKKDLEERFPEQYAAKKVHLAAAYSYDEEEAKVWAEEIQKEFPGFDFVVKPLSLSVACHIGPGALAIASSVDIED